MSNSHFEGVIVKELTENRKLGPLSTTHVSQLTCPVTCPLLKQGCYNETGYANFTTMRLNGATQYILEKTDKKSAKTDKIMLLAQAEAEGIRSLKGTRDLRMHVLGDSPNAKSAGIVSKAALEYAQKSGKTAFTYTHATNVLRSAWGAMGKGLSVIASCENIKGVENAMRRGYAAALVVKKFEKETAYKISDELTGIPCPYQTGRAENCAKCKLCMKDTKLRKNNLVVLFELHGRVAKSKADSIIQN